jgi:hypothetical protein
MRARCRCAIACAVMTLAGAGCEREIRPFQELSLPRPNSQAPLVTSLVPGGGRPPVVAESPFQNNAYGTAEGKPHIAQYNSTGIP